MNLTVCNLHLTLNPKKILYLSTSLLTQLKLAGKKSIQLRLGKASIAATVKPIKKTGKHLYVTAGLRKSLHVPRSGSIYVLNKREGVLQLGPLIGVMSDAPSYSAISPFGSRTPFIKQILSAGNKKAYIFAFSPRDINWQHNTVHALFVTATGGWVRKTVPLPDVVYNRLPSRRDETSTSIHTLRVRLTSKNIPFFNWSFFNKSDIYALLKNEWDVNRYVPESVMNPKPETIRTLLERHQFVYYKPSAGSLGNGIYRLTYLPKKGYFVRSTNNGKSTLLRFTQFTGLIRFLEARHGRSLRNYVVQQGVRLIKMDGCPIDFRFHMHKNGNNEWVVVGIGAKKAGKGSVTTHVKNGGKLMTPEQALERTFGSRGQEVLTHSKQVAIELAQAIERNYPHLLGELGLDLGIDRDEQVWMFEANAKPGRSIFRHPSLRVEGQSSIQHILEHCLYLSQFRKGEST